MADYFEEQDEEDEDEIDEIQCTRPKTDQQLIEEYLLKHEIKKINAIKRTRKTTGFTNKNYYKDLKKV